MTLYRHRRTGAYYRHKRSYGMGISTYTETDALGTPILAVRDWSVGREKQEQVVIITGMEKLIKIGQ